MGLTFQGYEAATVQIQKQRVRGRIFLHGVERAWISGRDRASRCRLDVGRCCSADYYRLRSFPLLQGEKGQVRHHGVKDGYQEVSR